MSLRALFAVVIWALTAVGPPAAGAAAGPDDLEAGVPDLPAVPIRQRLTLKQALESAASGNRSLLAVRADLEKAAAGLKAAWAVLLPGVQGEVAASWSGQTGGTGVPTAVGSSSRESLTAGVGASAALIDAGRWMAVAAARSGSDLTLAQVDQARHELLHAVAAAFWQTSALKALTSVYRAQVESLQEHLAFAAARFRTGNGSLADVRGAQIDLLDAWREAQAGIGALDDARAALGLLAGLDGLPWPEGEPPTAASPVGGTGPISGGLEANLDLRVARANVTLLERQLSSGWMQFLPVVRGTFWYGWQTDAMDGGGSGEKWWSAGLNLTVPLFDYPIYPDLQQKRAALRQARLSEEATRAEAASALAEARRHMRTNLTLVAAARRKAALADDLLGLAEAAWRAGTGLALAVTDARRSSLAAQVEAERLELELAMARLECRRRLGLEPVGDDRRAAVCDGGAGEDRSSAGQ